MYENGEIRPVATIPGRGEKHNDGAVNSNMIYCKNFCKCTPSTIIIRKGGGREQKHEKTFFKESVFLLKQFL
jgi:hypothetical protein